MLAARVFFGLYIFLNIFFLGWGGGGGWFGILGAFRGVECGGVEVSACDGGNRQRPKQPALAPQAPALNPNRKL